MDNRPADPAAPNEYAGAPTPLETPPQLHKDSGYYLHVRRLELATAELRRLIEGLASNTTDALEELRERIGRAEDREAADRTALEDHGRRLRALEREVSNL